jgi:hypothetical protein
VAGRSLLSTKRPATCRRAPVIPGNGGRAVGATLQETRVGSRKDARSGGQPGPASLSGNRRRCHFRPLNEIDTQADGDVAANRVR